MEIGLAVREMRLLAGLGQSHVAGLLGVSAVHWNNVEAGRSNPSPDLVERFGEIIGVSPWVFAWCRYGDTSELPKAMQQAAARLKDGWVKVIRQRFES